MTPKARKSPAGTKAVGNLKTIPLLKPDRDGGKTVLAALWKRRTDRTIGGKSLPPRALSNLLWAACGINRRKGPFNIPGRTAGSASNSQEIDVYVLLAEGVYLYEPLPHRLVPVAAGDLRSLAIGRGQSRMGARAPVRLLFVADTDKFKKAGFQEPGLWDPETQKAYYYVDTGLIAQNVYLYAASAGLACWFHNCDKAGAAAKLGLGPTQRPLFGQTLGTLSP
jgi:hypothetical protein